MPDPQFKFREGFWEKVAWGRPDSPQRPICSCCHGALPEVPLMLWREDLSALQLCDECVEKWVTVDA
jgi:hypothetical protein